MNKTLAVRQQTLRDWLKEASRLLSAVVTPRKQSMLALGIASHKIGRKEATEQCTTQSLYSLARCSCISSLAPMLNANFIYQTSSIMNRSLSMEVSALCVSHFEHEKE